MRAIPNFLIAEMTRGDLNRLSRDLFDLQRQTGTGAKANDLRGFAEDAGRIVAARTLVDQAEARANLAERIGPRLEAQGVALQQAGSAGNALRGALIASLANGDGRMLNITLQDTFDLITNALNESFEGEPLFAGERDTLRAVKVTTLDQLESTLNREDVFDESLRPRVMEVGGVSLVVGERAGEAAANIYNAMRELSRGFSGANGSMSQPLTDQERSVISSVVDLLDQGLNELRLVQGRVGETARRAESQALIMRQRADSLTNELGKMADANLAEVAMRLSATQTQYQAAASVFSQIRDLSLVNFLR
jgi:flagellin-like hook-associated protein FlgL